MYGMHSSSRAVRPLQLQLYSPNDIALKGCLFEATGCFGLRIVSVWWG